MKKFKSRLRPIIKLKELEEHKIKVELGRINQSIAVLREDISTTEASLSQSLDDANEMIGQGMPARMLQVYPLIQSGMREKIKQLNQTLRDKEELYRQTVEKLSHKKGEVKVFTQMNDREAHQFKREQNKKEEIEIQDTYMISKGKVV